MAFFTDVMTGGKSGEANSDLDKALAAIQGVKTPTIDDLKYKLEKLVAAGVLTPEKARAILQDPNALASMDVDQTGTRAQQGAISGLEGIVQGGGRDATEENDLQNIINSLNTQQRGQRDSILQGQAARGALTGGQTLAAQLNANQNDAANTNQLALGANANAEQRALQALTTMGQAGQGLQGQQNQQANTVAAATNAINQFNTAQQNQTEQWNTANANNAQTMNLANAQQLSNQNTGNENEYAKYQAQLPQQVYNDEMQKANALAGVYGNQAAQATGQGEQNAGAVGALTGATGSFFGSGPGGGGSFGKTSKSGGGSQTSSSEGGGDNSQNNLWSFMETAAGGGVIDADQPGEHATVPGDSPKNDRIPTMLSEGEGVIPRSVMNQPDSEVLAFLHRMRQQNKPKPHPEDTAHVLQALGMLRNGQ